MIVVEYKERVQTVSKHVLTYLLHAELYVSSVSDYEVNFIAAIFSKSELAFHKTICPVERVLGTWRISLQLSQRLIQTH